MARSGNMELDAMIGQYEHESQRPRADHALFSLRKIGSIVKPIMRRRNWKVGTLAEFFPSEHNLLGLNINRGQKINLRLRYPGDPSQFLPLEQVVDTMLHELCHIVVGPHNQEFHALWDQLRDEYESLIRKGYTGEGFLGKGQKLGGGRVPMHEARRLARQAAEQRRVVNAGSGQRLGGSGILRGQDPRSVIAAAVERRNKIEKGCASGTAAGNKIAEDEANKTTTVTRTQAEPEDENEATMMQAYIDLISEEEREKFGGYYSPPSAENPAGPRAAPEAMSKAKSLVEQQRDIEQQIQQQKKPHQAPTNDLIDLSDDTNTPRSRSLSPEPPTIRNDTKPLQPQPPTIPDTWTCEVCTLVNPINYLTCDACTVERPSYFSQLQEQQPRPPELPPRPASNTQRRETPNALKPRSSAYASMSRFEAERASKVASTPVGWQCVGCGNFMEQQWWTCSACGRMKPSS